MKETTTFGALYNPEVEITKCIARHAGVIRSFHRRFVRPLNTRFNPAVVNRYQLCTGVHVRNDLMALVLAVPSGERFRSVGI